MDIKGLVVNFAQLLGTQLAIDPVTGLPYTGSDQNYPAGLTVRANSDAPFSLAETDLPTWVIFTRGATYFVDQSIERLSKEARDLEAVLFVAIAQSGSDGEAERKGKPYVDSSRDLIQRHVQLYSDNPPILGLERAYLTKDTGIIVRKYAPSDPYQYISIGFTVRVEGWNEVTYAAQ